MHPACLGAKVGEEASLFHPAASGAVAAHAAVSSVMTTATNMYVRHTLPLEQARGAMQDRQTKAAVVVDDNFKAS